MRYELYVNQILWSVTHSSRDAFAAFSEWIGRGYSVNLRFVRTEGP